MSNVRGMSTADITFETVASTAKTSNFITRRCLHCSRFHRVDPCYICERIGHAPTDCQYLCGKMIPIKPFSDYDEGCVTIHTSANDDHVCTICNKAWYVRNIDSVRRLGGRPSEMCNCGGRHYYNKHDKYNCARCIIVKNNMDPHKFWTTYICGHGGPLETHVARF